MTLRMRLATTLLLSFLLCFLWLGLVKVAALGPEAEPPAALFAPASLDLHTHPLAIAN